MRDVALMSDVKDAKEKSDQLQAHLEDIIRRIETELGLQTIIAPRIRKRADGTEFESVSKSVTFNPIENQEISGGS